jgi:hypothetical protein
MSGQMTNDESKSRMSEWKRHLLIPSLMLCGFVSLLLCLISLAAATDVNVEHAYVDEDDVFVLPVNCFPSEPVKAWEFKVVYDPLYLTLIGIEEGDFFDGYQTFFIANGTTTYDLIIGKGNVTSSGNLVILSFTALQPGVTTVGLTGVGVCNETRYLPVLVTNGTVHINGSPVTPSHLWIPLKRGWNTFMPYTWATMTSLRIAWYAVFHRCHH